MDILLANPRGFCAGVDRAISIVESALEKFGAPIYVRHEVVHNRYVVNKLKEAGAVFVEELDEVPDDSIVIFSAHGVAKTVREMAKSRALKVFDATCPLVTKVVVADTAPEGAVATERDDLWLNVAQSAAAKCDRCWHHVEDVGTIAGHEEICGRCVTNVEGDGETRQFA